MRELRISDAELQRDLSRVLMARLKKAGFHTGAASDEQCTAMLPVRIDLAGAVMVKRDEAGFWIITQELHLELADRTAFTEQAHVAAIESREAPPCR